MELVIRYEIAAVKPAGTAGIVMVSERGRRVSLWYLVGINILIVSACSGWWQHDVPDHGVTINFAYRRNGNHVYTLATDQPLQAELLMD